jgi:hypothetical protein
MYKKERERRLVSKKERERERHTVTFYLSHSLIKRHREREEDKGVDMLWVYV